MFQSGYIKSATALGLLIGGLTLAATPNRGQLRPPSITPMNPHDVVGYMACAKCHANEIEVWKGTPHYSTFEQLHRRPEAKAIASKLGIRSIKYEQRCTSCHYTQKMENGQLTSISGVSCESCHGPAKNWLDLHCNYGGPGATKESETSDHRDQRRAESVAAGMRNPHNAYTMAQSCMRCHTVPDEELVNVGGHSTGSIDFEMISWSQGMVRHKFLASGGSNNDTNSNSRSCILFVSGMIADLEFSLRATAKATSKSDYGYSVAQRASQVAKRLASINRKCKVPTVRDVLEVYQAVRLSINNTEQLLAAADRIAALGYQFAEESDGSELKKIWPYVPKEDRWLYAE